MRKSRATQGTWTCVCNFLHRTPEECAIHLKSCLVNIKPELTRLRSELELSKADVSRLKASDENAWREVARLKDYFGINAGLNEGLVCACGGPLFKFSDPNDKTTICPFCAARYIASLKAGKSKVI